MLCYMYMTLYVLYGAKHTCKTVAGLFALKLCKIVKHTIYFWVMRISFYDVSEIAKLPNIVHVHVPQAMPYTKYYIIYIYIYKLYIS